VRPAVHEADVRGHVLDLQAATIVRVVRTGGKLSASISSIEPANGGIVSSGKRFI
jgi:hypothetical protein